MATTTKLCSRGSNCREHDGYRGQSNAEATHLLRRECRACGLFEVVYVCLSCADYIEDRNKKRFSPSGKPMNWRCLRCATLRPVPNGMDIIGAA